MFWLGFGWLYLQRTKAEGRRRLASLSALGTDLAETGNTIVRENELWGTWLLVRVVSSLILYYDDKYNIYSYYISQGPTIKPLNSATEVKWSMRKAIR